MPLINVEIIKNYITQSFCNKSFRNPVYLLSNAISNKFSLNTLLYWHEIPGGISGYVELAGDALLNLKWSFRKTRALGVLSENSWVCHQRNGLFFNRVIVGTERSSWHGIYMSTSGQRLVKPVIRRNSFNKFIISPWNRMAKQKRCKEKQRNHVGFRWVTPSVLYFFFNEIYSIN